MWFKIMKSPYITFGNLNKDDLGKVKMVCLSTTLASNAVVEERGGEVGLLVIGKMPDRDLPVDFCRIIRGKLDIKCAEKKA